MVSHSQSLDVAFHALSDPTRRAVVQRLVAGEAPVKDLAAPHAMGLPAFLKHLRVLEDSGLIVSRKVGRVRTCRLQLQRLADVEAWLADQRTLWIAQADRLAAYVETELKDADHDR